MATRTAAAYILAALAAIWGIVVVVLAISGGLETALGVVFLIIGILWLVSAYGIYKPTGWGRWLGIIVGVVGFILRIIGVITVLDFVPLVLAILLIAYPYMVSRSTP